MLFSNLCFSFRLFTVYPAGMSLPSVSLGDASMTTSVASLHTPMANLMSITETLPPGSPRNGSPPTGPQPPRTSSRGSQNSPSSGSSHDQFFMCDLNAHHRFPISGSSSGRRSSGSRHVSSTTVTSTEAQSQSNNNPASNNSVSAPQGNVNNSVSAVNGQSVDTNNVPAALSAPPVNPTLKCKLRQSRFIGALFDCLLFFLCF